MHKAESVAIGLLTIITLGILGFFLWYQGGNYGGDIIEYYGTTESLINHFSPNLTQKDEANLKQILNPAYLSDPLWYVAGRDASRYPVHFIFYSILLIPMRLILSLLQITPLDTFRITNLIILTATVFYIQKKFLITLFSKILFILLIYLSPIVSFLIWPGPDIFYMSMLLFAVFFFYHKEHGKAALFATLASWQSQPLLILASGMTLYYCFSHAALSERDGKKQIIIDAIPLSKTLGLLLLQAIPYVYNYAAFGVLTPWTIFQDINTRLHGFGFQNASLQKTLEMLFDLNIGLFWYAPIVVIVGGYFLLRHVFSSNNVDSSSFLQRHIHFSDAYILLLLLATALAYQTNPAWSYGSAGYGPTRHSLFFLPFLVYYFVTYVRPGRLAILLIPLFIVSQSYVLWFNGGLLPNLLNSLKLSPYATYVLNTSANLYNPTPEIFVDRTNHTDKDYITTAIYKNGNSCKKAYVLPQDKAMLIKECGFIPSASQKALDDPYLQKQPYIRKTVTTQATFWPDAFTCDYPLESKQYICMFTIDDVVRYTGVLDKSRFKKIDQYKGVWQLTWGPPVTITIPPGYFINHYSFKGTYVNY